MRFSILTVAVVALAGLPTGTARAECPDSVLFGVPHHSKDVGPSLTAHPDPDQAARYLAIMEKGYKISRTACDRGSTSGVAGCKDIPFYERSIAGLKCHAEESAAALARRLYSPLDRAYYTKFPDGDARLSAFWKFLSDLRAAREKLKAYCTGPSWSEMTHTVRGQVVLVWPERFKECEGYSDLLEHGDRSFETALQNWNAVFKSSYALPKGDAADAAAWKQTKSRFLRFTPDSCNDASRTIVSSREPGLADGQTSLYERMKSICPPQWRTLFEPAEDIAKRGERKRKFCAPGTSSTQIEEDGTQTMLCDESDRETPSDKRGRGTSSASTEEYIDDWISEGDGKQAPSMRDGKPASDRVKSRVRRPLDGGDSAGADPEGEEDTTDGAETSGTAATDGCDDAVELSGSEAMRTRRMQAIEAMAPGLGKQCAEARLDAELLQRGVSYAIRCNRRSELQALQSLLRAARTAEKSNCDAASAMGSRSSGPRTPIGPKGAGRTHRPSGPPGGRDLCPSGRPRVLDGCPGG